LSPENQGIYHVQQSSTRLQCRHLSVVLTVVSVILVGATASPAAKSDLELRPLPGDFLIDKTEGRESDDISVIYVPKDRHLTEVVASVTIYYVPGARISVSQLSPKWLGGEKKIFNNTEFRYGQIAKVELTGTANEHSFKDGEEIVKPLDIVEVKSFSQ
jgi:hypothetical protein